MYRGDAFGWAPSALMLMMVAVLAWALGSAWGDSQRPTLELKRDDWSCTKSETRAHLEPTQVGRSTVPVSRAHTVCLQYTRVAG